MTRAKSASSPRINPEAWPRLAIAPALLTMLAALTAACVTGPPATDSSQSTGAVSNSPVSPAALLRGEVITGPADPAPLPDIDALGLDDDMRRFVAENVDMGSTRSTRLRQLLESVIGVGRLGVEYDEQTYTAAETFRLREANCLSFTNMFIALGRQAGLKVSYQEVDIPPDWTQSGDMLVLNRHINAVVRSEDGRDRVVDFNIADFRAAYDRRVISDDRAMAHFYSNLGVDRMQASDPVGALRYFRKAIGEDAGFTPAWINLGVLYLRAGHPDGARSAWLHVLELDPGEQVAMSDLERLYRQRGEIAAADELDGRIERFRMQNPYYRYYLARQAFDNADYDAAIAQLKVAVRQKKTDDRFFALLGLSYLRRGDPDEARRWIAQAEEVAGDGAMRTGYHSKLEMLQRHNAG